MVELLFINFKNYPQAFNLFPQLYQDLEKSAWKYSSKVLTAFAPPSLLFAKVRETVKVPLWVQHLDPISLGACTGFLPAEALVKIGAVGTFLNHSEHPLDPKLLAETVTATKRLGLSTLIFAATLEAVSEVKKLNPDYITYEPPELIGGKVSVTSAGKEIIPEAVSVANPTPLLVGAGIHKGEDIQAALKFGSVGAVVSSAIVTALKPEKVTEELLAAF